MLVLGAGEDDDDGNAAVELLAVPAAESTAECAWPSVRGRDTLMRSLVAVVNPAAAAGDSS